MGPDLLESLKILTELVIQLVGHDLAEFTVLDVLLSVEEPVGDLVLARVLNNGHHTLNLKENKFGLREIITITCQPSYNTLWCM